MRDSHAIVAALALFLALVTFPFWRGVAAGTSAREPELKRPVGERACVLPAGEMRASHMDLLVDWREQVVRSGVRSWTAPDGRIHIMSLTGTCLRCHASKADFCDRCHDYAGVAPVCWSCHVDPASIGRSTP